MNIFFSILLIAGFALGAFGLTRLFAKALSEKAIGQGTTITAGVGITLILASLAYFVTPNTISSIQTHLDIAMAVLVIAWIGIAGIKKVEVGFKATLLIFGSRANEILGVDIFLGEGYHWVGPLPFLTDLKPVDCKERVTGLDLLKVLVGEKDKEGKVEVEIKGSIAWQVTRPNTFLATDPTVITNGLDDIFDQEIRTVATRSKLETFLGMKVELKDAIKAAADETVKKWGIAVTRVIISELKPDQEIVKALRRKKKELLERESEGTELDFAKDQIVDIARRTTLSAQDSMELFQSEREDEQGKSKVPKTIEKKTFELGTVAAGVIGTAISGAAVIIADALAKNSEKKG